MGNSKRQMEAKVSYAGSRKRCGFIFGASLCLWASLIACGAKAAETNHHFQQATRYEFSGDVDAAFLELARGLEECPDSAEGHTRLGILLLEEKGNIDAAISEFLTALSIEPGNSFCQARLDQAVRRKNESCRDGIARGNDLYRTGQLRRSAAAYRLAVSADAKDAEARNCLAWTLYRIGKLEEAMQEVQMALKLKPDEPEYVNTLACVQFDQGNVDTAMANWNKAIARSKTPNPADLYGLAIGYLSKGDKPSAIKNFKEAVKSDSNYLDSVYLRDKVGMSIHALAMHAKLLDLSGALAEKETSQSPKANKKELDPSEEE